MTDKAKDKPPKALLKATPKPLTATSIATARTAGYHNPSALQLHEATQTALARLFELPDISPTLQLVKSFQSLNLAISQQVVEAMRPTIMAADIMASFRLQMTAVDETINSFSANIIKASDLMESLRPLTNALIDLSSLQSTTNLSSYATRRLDLQDLTIESEQVEATSLASTEISIGKHFKVVRTEVVAVSARLDRVEASNRAIYGELQDIKQLILTGKANLIAARINSFTITKDGSKLVINNQPINLDPNSMQAYLANTLFGSDKSVSIKWHIEDIAQRFDSQAALDDIKGWNDKFYQAARSLNSKISIILATPTQAILYRQQEYWVNPELIDLIHS